MCLQFLREIAERVRPPRALIVPFRHGYPLDQPFQPQRQMAVIDAALKLLEDRFAAPPVLRDFASAP
ncbi:MAG: hypothetical protein AB1813_05650 [Verrucomicrobiota bacterium]